MVEQFVIGIGTLLYIRKLLTSEPSHPPQPLRLLVPSREFPEIDLTDKDYWDMTLSWELEELRDKINDISIQEFAATLKDFQSRWIEPLLFGI